MGIGRSGKLYTGCHLHHMTKFLSSTGFDNLKWNLDHFWADSAIQRDLIDKYKKLRGLL